MDSPQPCIARIANHEGRYPIGKQSPWVLPLRINEKPAKQMCTQALSLLKTKNKK